LAIRPVIVAGLWFVGMMHARRVTCFMTAAFLVFIGVGANPECWWLIAPFLLLAVIPPLAEIQMMRRAYAGASAFLMHFLSFL
jgi:hypothetical protein